LKPETRTHSLIPFFRRWLRRSAPRNRGELSLSGLGDNVKVFWRPPSVPHVYAESERDLFLAQGYLHAQERLWQMELNRRALCGRNAEIFGDRPIPGELSVHVRGKTLAELDYFIRLLGMRRAALASLRCLSDREMAILEAYSTGVNRYIETHVTSLPLEFRLLRFTPEPWRPEDTLTLGKGFAFFLSTSLFTRVAWTAIAANLPDHPEKLAALTPRYPSEGPTIARALAAEAKELIRFISGTFELFGAAAGQGSNNWVVAPDRSASGCPILCNDPHLKLELPSTWYLMHLSAASERGSAYEAWGGTIPGMPFVQIGRNRRIAWGVTAALCDDADLYRETLHPHTPDLYLAKGRWTQMDVVEENIAVRRGKTVPKNIRLTNHGPLISDFLSGGGASAREALAFKWTAHAPSREFTAVDGVNRARNWPEFRAALAHQTAPSLNYLYADCDGNIGYSLAGAVPIRAQRPSFLPLAATDADADWKGFIPFEKLPCLYNPPEGVIATANNDIAGAAYPYHLSDLFEPPYRIGRIKQLLASKDRFSIEDMMRIQQDTVSLHARTIIDIVREEFSSLAGDNGSLGEAALRLIEWDGDCRENSVAAALFHCFYHHLTLHLLVPTLGAEMFRAYVEIFNQSLFPMQRILNDPASPWFAERSRRSVVEAALSDACKELKTCVAAEMPDWQWGKIHTLSFNHPLDGVRGLKSLLSIAPIPTGGDGATINLGFFRRSRPYAHTVGASLRMIAEMSDPPLSLFMTVPGQSGHFFSPHYLDQLQLWRNGDYLQIDADEKTMTDWPLLILTPESRRA
jgi:penicillin amidase